MTLDDLRTSLHIMVLRLHLGLSSERALWALVEEAYHTGRREAEDEYYVGQADGAASALEHDNDDEGTPHG